MKCFTTIALTLTAALFAACTGGPTVADTDSNSAAQMMLAGSEWGLSEADDANTDVFIGFKSDGKVSGHAGCNSFFSSYNQDGENLSIGLIGSTKKMCPPEIMETERALFKALSDTQSITASHLSLILRGANGTSLLTLRRRDWD